MGNPALAPAADRRDASRRQSDMALVEVMKAVTLELADLAADGERLQDILGEALARAGASPDHSLIEEAQGLDLMVQRLSALSQFIQAFGPDMPASWRLDMDAALGAVPLADLAARLGRPGADAPATSGDLDLF